MRRLIALGALASSLAMGAPALAAVTVAAPAPLLGAGIPSLAILAATGAGYAYLRFRRKNRD
jgi:hypothetical protein